MFFSHPLRIFLVLLLLLPFDAVFAQEISSVQLQLGNETALTETSTVEAIAAQNHTASDLDKPTLSNINITVSKCCELGQIFLEGKCRNSSRVHQFSPQVDVTEDEEKSPYSREEVTFVPAVSLIKCPQRRVYYLDHNSPTYPDNYTLLTNGSLLLIEDGQLVPYMRDQFCFETIKRTGEDNEVSWDTLPLLCSPSVTPPALFYVYASGLLISSIFLIATVLVFLLVKDIRDTRGKCIAAYSLSMAISFVVLAIAQLSGIEDSMCEIFGFIIQFLLVLSFTWFTMLSFETLYKIINFNKDTYTNDRSRFFKYLVLGTAIPIFVFIISYWGEKMSGLPSSFLKPKFEKHTCWFDDNHNKGNMLRFYVPTGFLIIINILLVTTMRVLIFRFEKTRKNDITFGVTKVDLKAMFRANAFVLIVMMLCYIMDIITTLREEDIGGVGIAFDVVGSLQGIFVLLIFVMHRPVKPILKKYLRGKQRRQCVRDVNLFEEES